MPSPILSIIAASASAVGKTFVIGLVGYLSTKYPKDAPLIPLSSLSLLSRMTFNMLIIPLIYTGVASSVELSELESLYPIIILSFAILLISYVVTVCLGYLPCFRMQNETYFTPLCIASTFPNIVALPIIIFPTLCEYGVVQDLVGEDIDHEDFAVDGESSLMDICNKQVNSIVFTYFFGFSIVFWSVGHRALKKCKVTQGEEDGVDGDQYNFVGAAADGGRSAAENPIRIKRCTLIQRKIMSKLIGVKNDLIEIFKQPGFVAMLLGFFTACIGPMQRALFDAGGSLRVAGSALESLSNAGTTFATIVVAASLVREQGNGNDESTNADGDQVVQSGEMLDATEKDGIIDTSMNSKDKESDIESEDESRDKMETAQRKESLRSRILDRVFPTQRKDMKIYIWQVTSRLLVTPGIVFFLLLKLECSGLLGSIPNIAKLVLLINSAVPGALVVVVILKAEGLALEAAAVSNTYLSSYVISVVTLAMWSSIGLLAFRPDSGIC